MASIYNYSKNVFLQLRERIKEQPAVACVVLMLLSVPLAYAANSISLGILILFVAINHKFRSFTPVKALLLPVLLYVLMGLSLIWTIDRHVTFQALSKELPLILVPLCFMQIPAFSSVQKQLALKYYSWGLVLYCIFYLLKATVRYAISNDISVFFYHELVTLDVNAIHVSIYMSIAFFWFLIKKDKTTLEHAAMFLLFLMVFFLSSKTVILIFVGLLIAYYLFFAVSSWKPRVLKLATLILFIGAVTIFIKPIRERFKIEYETAMSKGTVNQQLSRGEAKVYNVSIGQAWSQDQFHANDFFPGTAFRVFKFRIFTEMLQADNIFWQGYGLNASYPKIAEKTVEHGLFLGDGKIPGYQGSNFHNQYIQTFAELGIFGLLVLMAMLVLNLKKAFKNKDFVHISFAILMISLFLTESFLWRQRGVTFFTVMYCLFNAGNAGMLQGKDKRRL